MKIYQKYYTGKGASRHEIDISDAVEAKCDGADYDRGALETAQATARNTSQLLGRLVELLHAQGVLSDAQIQEFFLPYDVEVEP